MPLSLPPRNPNLLSMMKMRMRTRSKKMERRLRMMQTRLSRRRMNLRSKPK